MIYNLKQWRCSRPQAACPSFRTYGQGTSLFGALSGYTHQLEFVGSSICKYPVMFQGASIGSILPDNRGSSLPRDRRRPTNLEENSSGYSRPFGERSKGKRNIGTRGACDGWGSEWVWLSRLSVWGLRILPEGQFIARR